MWGTTNGHMKGYANQHFLPSKIRLKNEITLQIHRMIIISNTGS